MLQESNLLHLLMGEASYKIGKFYSQHAFPRLKMETTYTAFLMMRAAFEHGALRRSSFSNREADGALLLLPCSSPLSLLLAVIHSSLWYDNASRIELILAIVNTPPPPSCRWHSDFALLATEACLYTAILSSDTHYPSL